MTVRFKHATTLIYSFSKKILTQINARLIYEHIHERTQTKIGTQGHPV